MQGTDWFPLALFGLGAVVIVLLLLLLKSQKRLRAARAGAQVTAIPGTGFTENQEYRLLAKQELFIDGTVHDFGVVETDSSVIRPYLVNINMHHIKVGEHFCYRNNSPYRVNVHDPAPTPPLPSPAPIPEPARVAAPPQIPPATASPARTENALAAAPAFSETEADDQENLSPASNTADIASPISGLAYLEVIDGPDTGTRFPLAFNESTIGRGEVNAVKLADEGASRLHCKILYNSRYFVLTDVQSTNGTLCNEEFVKSQALEFGDQIQVSDTVMVFTCRGHELKETDPTASIAAFKHCLDLEPDFMLALKGLASLLEHDPVRKNEAEPLRRKIAQLDRA